VKEAMKASVDVDGPVYIRIGSGREEKVFPDGTPFELGKIRILKSYGNDVALFCNGFILNRVLKAAAELEAKGVHATVVEVATLKPLDVEGISTVLDSCGCAVTIEDHNVIGALGSAVAEVIAEGAPAVLARLGLQDTYAESGYADELLDAYGMSEEDIVATAIKVIAKKK
jgi:transketolase